MLAVTTQLVAHIQLLAAPNCHRLDESRVPWDHRAGLDLRIEDKDSEAVRLGRGASAAEATRGGCWCPRPRRCSAADGLCPLCEDRGEHDGPWAPRTRRDSDGWRRQEAVRVSLAVW